MFIDPPNDLNPKPPLWKSWNYWSEKQSCDGKKCSHAHGGWIADLTQDFAGMELMVIYKDCGWNNYIQRTNGHGRWDTPIYPYDYFDCLDDGNPTGKIYTPGHQDEIHSL